MDKKYDKGKTECLIPERVFREMLVDEGKSKYKWVKAIKFHADGLNGIYEETTLEAIQKVLEFGIEKYKVKNSWQNVPDGQQRYMSAFYRHSLHPIGSEDKESGLPHIFHLLCNCMFLLWFEIQEDINSKIDK